MFRERETSVPGSAMDLLQEYNSYLFSDTKCNQTWNQKKSSVGSKGAAGTGPTV